MTHMFQGLTVLQQYFNATLIFSYDLNDKRRLEKRKNKGQLETASEKANTFFFPGSKISAAPLVTISPKVKCC